jgi:hypothetical protein
MRANTAATFVVVALHEALVRVDARALRCAAHRLKGSSHIGAVQMAQLWADLEEQARTAELAGARQTLRRRDAAFGRLHAHLQAVAGRWNKTAGSWNRIDHARVIAA